MLSISDLILFIIIILIYNIYSYDKYSIKKDYNKKFKFNNLNYHYYPFYLRPITIFNSSSNCISILDKFDISSNDSFLDIGSGDGYILLYVNKKYNFKSIYGVEIDEKIYNQSLYNINLINTNKIKVYNKDATKFKIPKDVNYIYLFNPFAKVFYKKKIDNDELEKYNNIVSNIKKSYKENPRKITIIFTNIRSNSDKDNEILKLFSKNFKIIEENKLFMNIVLKINYAIFVLK
tara:strand:- start:87 stop:788 length:702 start_codon:yes stop_codon:yes gene_type:complete